MTPASVHVQPADFHGRDSQGKREELHKKARMETLRIIFNLCFEIFSYGVLNRGLLS